MWTSLWVWLLMIAAVLVLLYLLQPLKVERRQPFWLSVTQVPVTPAPRPNPPAPRPPAPQPPVPPEDDKKHDRRRRRSEGNCLPSHPIDLICFCDRRLKLLADGRMEVESKSRIRIVGNFQAKRSGRLHLTRLAVFDGGLWGVGGGHLFRLHKHSRDCWVWRRWGDWSSLTHLSATLDGEHLWVQTTDTGWLLATCSSSGQPRILECRTSICNQRVYGKDPWNFLELTPLGELHHYVGGNLVERQQHVRDAVVDQVGKIFTVSANNARWQGIRLTDGRPEYF